MEADKKVYELTVRTKFSAAHKLWRYKGRCSNLHGHTWNVEVSVIGSELDNAGILIDFVELKNIINDIVKNFDHNYLNEIPPFSRRQGKAFLNPTAENIAKVIFQGVKDNLSHNFPQVQVKKVCVRESPNTAATYSD